MVRITFSGAWPAENRVQALRVVQRTLLDALHLQTDPAYYRIETEPAQARGIAVHVALFPAGSARMRRAAADRLLRYFSEAEGLPAPQSSVVISTPQQEREEEVWKGLRKRSI